MSTAIAALPFYGGGTLACFDPSDNTVVETTAGGTYNSTFSTCGLYIASNIQTSNATSPTWPVAATLWTHFVHNVLNTNINSVESNFLNFYNSATLVAKVTIALVAGPLCQYKLYTLQSGVMTAVGSVTLTHDANLTFDVKLVGNTASGAASLYSAGTLAINGTGLNHSGWSGVTQIQLWGGFSTGGGSRIVWSQVACQATSTVGMFLKDDVLNANGATQQWTNGVSAINEIPTDDSTFIYVATSNQTSVFKASGLSLAGYVITGRGVGARMKIQGTSPPKIRLVIRSGATNFASSAIVAASNFQAAFNSWTSDPHTSIAWTATNAAVAQNGVQSSS